jgi:hypothetical protein
VGDDNTEIAPLPPTRCNDQKRSAPDAGTALAELGYQKGPVPPRQEGPSHIGFVFKYDRKQQRFVILKEPFLPVYDLKLTELFALTMAVRQLSAAGDHLLTFGAINAIKKIIANAPGPQRDMLSENLREFVLQQGFGCQERVLDNLQTALLDQRRVIIRYQPPLPPLRRTTPLTPTSSISSGGHCILMPTAQTRRIIRSFALIAFLMCGSQQ